MNGLVLLSIRLPLALGTKGQCSSAVSRPMRDMNRMFQKNLLDIRLPLGPYSYVVSDAFTRKAMQRMNELVLLSIRLALALCTKGQCSSSVSRPMRDMSRMLQEN